MPKVNKPEKKPFVQPGTLNAPAGKPNAKNQKPVVQPGTLNAPAGKPNAKNQKPATQPEAPVLPASKPVAKEQKSRVGGTAIQGAKSTQPKEVTTKDPQRQETESYNREMRRRMQHMKTGPYSDAATPQQQRRKKLERRKQEAQDEVQKLRGRSPGKITLGRRNTYFVIAVAAILVLLIVIAILFQMKIL
ncbi:MAG: hypothetical protein M3Z08_14235 [Chloroflexota bacterium]|nr:hypothetical protein [Chloroflexota bacterium]